MSSLARVVATAATGVLLVVGGTALVTGTPGSAGRSAVAPARPAAGASPVAAAVAALLDPDAPGCRPSRLTRFVAWQLRGVEPQQLRFLLTNGVLDLPADEAALLGRAGEGAWAPNPATGADLERALSSTQRFWGGDAADVGLLAVHGGVLRDPVRLTRLLTARDGLAPRAAALRAQQLIAAVAAVPELQGGDNPVLTLGASALAEEPGAPGQADRPARLLVGDGLLAFLASIGVADVGPEVVVSQQVADLVAHRVRAAPVSPADTTRRRQERAVALGSYAASSRRGLSLDAWRVVQAAGAVAEVQACTAGDREGAATPDDQRRVAWWGADAASRERGRRVPAPRWLVARLDAALPQLLAGTRPR
ncbi:hypothetical protein [Kineococcus rubinsiae]|uniref:hypothetical protein n=1 Tax=Kineococcus rubinsiae TaxID=2609562 RepID=UPI0014311B1D|nr:hypothetical protein [Kineococcus rubinsiae]NIZ89952.1 hypothetical protein [Kineococcus rubinsiae]